MVFQKPNPFPKTIFENIAYGMRINGVKDKALMTERVETSLQQAARVSDITAFFYMGKLIEVNKTDTLFTKPELKQTEQYITGRFG